MQKFLFFILFFSCTVLVQSQQITGYWKGKIGTGLKNRKVELKLVLKGDSIVGTSYYYESKNNFKRYSIKGYFNPRTNAVIWWDDILLESKQPKLKISSPGEVPFIAEADFNCPGGGIMMLDGKSKPLEKESSAGEKIHLDKVNSTGFEDEWNLVIDNWMDGGNEISFIDSIQHIAFNKAEYEKVKPLEEIPENPTILTDTKKEPVVVLDLPVKKQPQPNPLPIPEETNPAPAPAEKINKPIEFLDLSKPNKKEPPASETPSTEKKEPAILVQEQVPVTVAQDLPNKQETVQKNQPVEFLQVEKPKKPLPDTMEQPILKEKPIAKAPPIPVPIEVKFMERKKVVLTEIPIAADSIELRFYDNADVDGDSISLFINKQLWVEHIRLSDRPYIVILHKDQLIDNMELTMVAENLGAIPPNTSYMVAFVNGKKYDATLSSTEQSSAVIRFSKPK